MARKATNKDKFYVTNEGLLPQIYIYRDTGEVTDELGEMLQKIAANFAKQGKFNGYTWKDDMCSEAVLTCILYMHNFNPIKYKNPNPFAYFTSIVRNAFLNYIRKQKKHSEIKDWCYHNHELISVEKGDDFFKLAGIDYTEMKQNGNKK